MFLIIVPFNNKTQKPKTNILTPSLPVYQKTQLGQYLFIAVLPIFFYFRIFFLLIFVVFENF